jgi:LysM repeat protein
MGLSNLFDGLGEVAKLKIIAYSDSEYKTELGDFTVMYNPNTFSRNYKTVWLPDKSLGSAGENKKFRRLESDSVSFEFLFDGTGVSHVNVPEINKSTNKSGYVQKQIDAFLKITRTISSDTHEPNFLELSWGDFIFHGVMESATVNYKLFHSSGAPLRATISANFKESISQPEQAAKKKINSPDLTHLRVVKAGENLPLIAQKVYGDPAFYMEIARVNNLKNFRKLKEGTQLVLPPIDKKVNA